MSYSETSYNAWVYYQLEPNDILRGCKKNSNAIWKPELKLNLPTTLPGEDNMKDDYEYLNEDDI